MAGGGTKLADAYVQIIPVAEGITGRLSDLFKDLPSVGDETGEKAGESFASKLKKTIAAAGVTAAIGKIVKDAFSEGAELEQSLGGVETLFKKHADIVKKNAEEAYRTAGISANEYMQNVTSFSASLLSSLGGDTKKAAEIADMAMVDMSDNANKFGTDMSAIQNAYQGFAKQNYTMLDNLKLGYGGTKTEMERLLQDAQKFSGVKYNIDNLNDVYEAIHVIQENLDVTGTTAKEAGSTFSGSFASMKAAAKNFLGALTTGGDVKKALSNLTQSTKVFFDNVKRFAKNMLDGVDKLFDAAMESMLGKLGIEGETAKAVIDGLKVAIEAAAVAMVAFKIAANVSAITKHMTTLKLETIQTELAAKGLSLAFMGVMGAVTVAALALNSIISDMAEDINVVGDFEWQIHDLTEATKEFKEKCDETAEKVSDLHEAVKKNSDAAKSQAAGYKSLIDRMSELNSKTNRSKKEQAELESIVSQLNDDIPEMNLSLDSQTGALKNNIETVKKMAEAYVDMGAGTEIQEKLGEAIANQEEAEIAFAEALERRNAAKAEGIDLYGDEYEALTLALQEARDAKNQAEEDVNTIREQIDAMTEAQKNFESGFGDMTQYVLNLSHETLEGISSILDEYQEAYQTQHSLVFDQMNLLDEFCGASDVTKETLQKNLQDNINGFTGWESDLSVLRGKVAAGIISQDFYDNLKEMGPKGAGYAKAFVSMTDEELKQYSVKSKGIFDEMNSYVDRSMSAMKNEAAVQLDKLIDLPGEKSNEMKIAYEMLGRYATEGYAEGIRNGTSDVDDAVREMIQSAINETKKESKTESPSKVFRSLGGFISEGYALGIEDEASLAAKASGNMVRQAIDSANKANDKVAVSAIKQAALMSAPTVASSSAGMKYAFLEALAEYGSVGGGRSRAKQPLNVNVVLGKRAIGKAVVDDINQMTKQNGKSPLI